MGMIPVGASAVAAYLFYRANAPWLMTIAVLAGSVSLWTFGLMHNYAVDAAKRRSSYRGGFGDFTAAEAEGVPDGLAMTNMATAIIIAILVIVSLVWAF